MSDISIEQHLAANKLRLSPEDTVVLAGMVKDIARLSSWLSAQPLSYMDEPAVVFHAKPR